MAWHITIGSKRPNEKHKFAFEETDEFGDALRKVQQAAIDKCIELEIPWDYATVSPGVEYEIPENQKIDKSQPNPRNANLSVTPKKLKWD